MQPSLLAPIVVVWLSAYCVGAHAQSLWQGTRYGASVAEVQGTVPSARAPEQDPIILLDGSKELLRIPKLDLIERPFVAGFFFREQKLEQVQLYLRNISKPQALDTFDTLRPVLEKKYGKGRERSQTGTSGSTVNRSVLWVTEGLEISLNLWMFEHVTSDVYIVYRRLPNQGTDKL